MFYEKLGRPLLFQLNPEFVHRKTVRTAALLSQSRLALRLLHRIYGTGYGPLEVQALGLKFTSPVGLAAGFDKNAEFIPIMGSLGFGHLEVGSVSLNPWPGNPSPTLLRLPRDGGLINWLGLNSDGSVAVRDRLLRRKPSGTHTPLFLNLVKTADPKIVGDEAIEDFTSCFMRMYPLGDGITLNLSCPNTPEGRTFEHPATLRALLQRLPLRGEPEFGGGRRKPILIKLSPDLPDDILSEILDMALQHCIDGIVISNTTVRRDRLHTSPKILDRFGPGGVSGRPLKPLVTNMIRRVIANTHGKLPVIACGGVGCDPKLHPAQEVWDYLSVGATLVQLHTGLIYRGPSLVGNINRGLLGILKSNKLPSMDHFLKTRVPTST